MCIADLAMEAGTADDQERLREDADAIHANVVLGEGTYTIYAGQDDDGQPRYGLEDEASKLNINTADASILEKLPELDSSLAAAIVAVRGEEPFRDLKDLLQIEGIDPIVLYGEDQNENGLLDANENDGDQNWPPDNADGWLDGGLTRFLTAWSASRNVSADGTERANLNQDDADTLTQTVKEISQQQADSIVARRENGEFASVLDLLDVELVEVTNEQPQEGEKRPEQGERPPPQTNGKPDQAKEDGKKEDKEASKKDTEKEGAKEKPPDQKGEPKESEESGESQQKPKATVKGTGQKAFDEAALRKIADLVTTNKDDVRQGQININTASREVLACVPGLDESLAEAIVRERETRAGGFTTTIDLLDVNGMTIDKLKQCYETLTARSDVFTVRSYGVLDAGAAFAGVSAVVDRSDDTIKVLHWQEYE